MREMTDDQIQDAIQASWLGVLSLARGSRAYAFPLFYAYREGTFYFHSHPGQKDDYIHATEEACLTIVRAVTEDDWTSVAAFGHVEEIRKQEDIEAAEAALISLPQPPELGETETGEPKRSSEDVHYWMLEPHTLTGRISQRPAPE